MITTPLITRVDGGQNGRHYRVEGFSELFPSVTNVLGVISKPALVPWARNVALQSVRETLTEYMQMEPSVIDADWVASVIDRAKKKPDQVRDEAGDFGTQAHLLIEQIINGLEPDIPPEMQIVVDNFFGWRKESGLEISLTETMVYSAKYKYAGAMDALAYRDGRMVAIDWKTSNGLYGEYALQVAAYAKALEEMTGEVVSEAWAVRFGKKAPEFEAKKVIDLDGTFIAFRAALYLWRAMQHEHMTT